MSKTLTEKIETNDVDALVDTLTIGATNATLSQSYGSALTSGSLDIGANITGGEISIGSNITAVNAGGVLLQYNSIKGGESAILPFRINHNHDGPIEIGDIQPIGDLNIGTGIRSGGINIGTNTNGAITIGKSTTITTIDGKVRTSNVDTSPGNAMEIGTMNASKIGIGRVGINTRIFGNAISNDSFTATGGIKTNTIDSVGGLSIGNGIDATTVTIGKSGYTTTILGDAIINEALTVTDGVATNRIDSTGVLSIATGGDSTSVDISRSGYTTILYGNATINEGLTSLNGVTTNIIDSTDVLYIANGGDATSVNISKPGQLTSVLGDATIDGTLTTTSLQTATGGINTPTVDTTGLLAIGTATATSIDIGKTGQLTRLLGDASVVGDLTIGVIKTNALDSTGALSIATGTSATTVNISKPGQTTSIGGEFGVNGVTTATGGIRSNAYQGLNIGDPITVGNTTTGSISIGGAQVTAPLFIGNNPSRTGPINIGSLSNSVRVSNINVTANAINAGGSTPLLLGGGASTNGVTVGRSGATNSIQGNTTVSNTLGVNGLATFSGGATVPTTLGVTGLSSLTGGILTGQPIGTTYTGGTFNPLQLGYSIAIYLTTDFSLSNNVVTTPFNPGLPIGVWVCNYSLLLKATSGTPTLTSFVTSLKLATLMNGVQNYAFTYNSSLSVVLTSAGNYAAQGHCIINNTVANNISLPITAAWSGVGQVSLVANNSYFTATRIA